MTPIRGDEQSEIETVSYENLDGLESEKLQMSAGAIDRSSDPSAGISRDWIVARAHAEQALDTSLRAAFCSREVEIIHLSFIAANCASRRRSQPRSARGSRREASRPSRAVHHDA